MGLGLFSKQVFVKYFPDFLLTNDSTVADTSFHVYASDIKRGCPSGPTLRLSPDTHPWAPHTREPAWRPRLLVIPALDRNTSPGTFHTARMVHRCKFHFHGEQADTAALRTTWATAPFRASAVKRLSMTSQGESTDGAGETARASS